MNILKNLFFYVFMGVIIGIGCLGYYVPYDPRILRLIEHTVQHSIEESHHLKMRFSIERLNIFALQMNIKDLTFSPLYNSTWSVSVTSLAVCCSIEDSLRAVRPVINVLIDGVFIKSVLQNYLPTIIHHLPSTTLDAQWYTFNNIKVQNAFYEFEDPSTHSLLKGSFDTSLYLSNNIVKGNCSYNAAECTYNAQEYIKKIHGEIQASINLSTMGLQISSRGYFKLALVPFAISTWHYQARYLDGQGIVTLNIPDGALCLQIAPIIIGPTTCNAQMTSFVFLERLSCLLSFLPLSGIIKTHIQLSISPDTWSIRGSSLAKDISVAKKNSYDAIAHFTLNNIHLNASCIYRQQNDSRCYRYTLHGNPSKNLFIARSSTTPQENNAHSLAIVTNAWWLPQSLFVFHTDHQTSLARIDIPVNNFAHPIKATFNYQLIAPFLEYYTKLKLLGNSTLSVCAQPSLVGCEIRLHSKGKIYFPMMYNFIRSLKAHLQFVYASQILRINRLNVLLEKGSISINNAYIAWKDKKQPELLDIPIYFSDIFINHVKHAYAWLSGSLVVHKNKDSMLIKGDISIDKSSFYANPFSKVLQKTVRSFSEHSYKAHSIESELNINVHTSQPVIIKTSLLRALVDTHITIKGTTTCPIISGILSIKQGELLFAYKPLSLISGHITLLAYRHNDPLIEFIARGTFRRHQVTIYCQGSVNNPQLHLSSTPSLTQEQIVTLLMTGSPEGNLGLLMPSLIINNLYTLLFDQQEQSSKAQQYIKTLLSPLRYVKFVPNFADQTARGGFRGSIQIDVGNNLRATIKKNFSLIEDTKIEAEYTLSDDVTIRGLKDERGDLGGEIEMRFKF